MLGLFVSDDSQRRNTRAFSFLILNWFSNEKEWFPPKKRHIKMELVTLRNAHSAQALCVRGKLLQMH